MPAFPTSRPGTLANIVPPNPLTQQVAAIKEVARRIDANATAQSGNAMTVNRKPGITLKGGANITVLDGGSIVINDAGDLIMLAADGTVVFAAGKDTIPDGTGRTQQSFYVIRDDGTPALVCSDLGTSPGHTHQQALQWFDRSGRTVFSDDTSSGTGMARPYMGGLVMADTNATRWPQTTSATFVDIAMGYFTVQNPRVQFDIQTVADAATAGQVKLLINGTQIDTTQNVTSSFALWERFQVALPASATVGSIATVELQACRTSGTGNVYASLMRWEGDQSP